MENTIRITYFPVLLRSHHQTFSNDMPFVSLPLKPVLFAITEFVALLYDSTRGIANKILRKSFVLTLEKILLKTIRKISNY